MHMNTGAESASGPLRYSVTETNVFVLSEQINQRHSDIYDETILGLITATSVALQIFLTWCISVARRQNRSRLLYHQEWNPQIVPGGLI